MVARGEALAADGSGTVTEEFEGAVVLDEPPRRFVRTSPARTGSPSRTSRHRPAGNLLGMSSTTGDSQAVRRKRPAKPQFTQTILVLEAILVFFATLAGDGLRLGPSSSVWLVGGGLSLLLIVLSGFVSRPGGYVAGSVAQVLVLASGIWVPTMFVVGGIFVILWWVALRLGGRIDRERAEYDAAHPEAVGP